jgi:hypothetical protein
MTPKEAGARFAAFVWITHAPAQPRTAAEARRFAQENWKAFLSGANEGLGRLLIRLARTGPEKATQRRRDLASCGG